MEAFWILPVAGLIFGPLILSIIALAQASKANREVRELAARLNAGGPIPASAPPVEKSSRPLPPALPAAEAAPAHADRDLEVALGGKAASFVGIAAVVISIAFFVGYAIQHNWLGPAARIAMGLAAGAGLVLAGHIADRRSDLHTLARALTGGGCALFYFTVFAAYGVYHLVGAQLAGLGLVASAAIVLVLAVRYDSLAVALLGVVGAFITPMLVESAFHNAIFPLVYVALVNVPVLGLGLRKDWPSLYNLAFAFTVLYALPWMADEIPGQWRAGLAFAVLFHAQFAALNFRNAGRARGGAARALDLGRLMISAVLLGLALYWILTEAEKLAWRGPSFVAAGLVCATLAWRTRERTRGLADETLAFAGSAIAFLSFALPVQLDGAWVALGWGIEGAALAWFALRARQDLLQAGAIALGVLGVIKTAAFDVTLLVGSPPPFANSHFAVGLIASALLAAQAWMHGRQRPRARCASALYVMSVAAGLIVMTLETGRLRGPWTNSLVTLLWAASAMALTTVGLARQRAYLRYAGLSLFGITVIKVFIVDLADLRGLPRIAAFMGVGVLLLLLSYVYQRVAPGLLAKEEPKADAP